MMGKNTDREGGVTAGMKFFVANSKQNTCVHGVVEITIFNPAAAPSGADSRDIFFFSWGVGWGD